MNVKGATGNVGNGHYIKWKQDVATMAGLGVKTYRFSISWPRIVPTGMVADGISQEGLEFYHSLVDELLAVGIQPVITMYHWDLPQGLLDASYYTVIPVCDDLFMQGWFECKWGAQGRPVPTGLSSKIAKHFVNYAELILREFAGKVSDFYTFNEPWTFTFLGTGYGHAPGVAPYNDNAIWPYVAAHNVILAHLKAVQKFRELQRGELASELASARIGIALNAEWKEPKKVSLTDIAAAVRAIESSLSWFADPVWGRPDGFHDYPESMKRLNGDALPSFTAEEQKLLKESRPDIFGLNYYSGSYVRACTPKNVSTADGSTSCEYDCSCTPSSSQPNCEEGLSVPDRVNAGGQSTVASGTPFLPQVQSLWLHPSSWTFRKMLAYVAKRYGNPPIFVTENGASVAAASPSDSQYDAARVLFLFSYLSAMHSAIIEDGVNVQGYYVWSLMDNFEWSMGYSERFGILFNDFQFCETPDHPSRDSSSCDPHAPGAGAPIYNHETGEIMWSTTCGIPCLVNGVPNPSIARKQTRHTKNSASWLSEVWETNSLVDFTFYLFNTLGPQCWGEGVYHQTYCSTARRRGRVAERREPEAL